MNTKKALDILSKGEASPASPLAQHRERYVEAFEQRNASILQRQNADVVQLPFLDALRRKVAKMVDSPDNNLPVVGRYDLYVGVRKLAERSANDNGLTRLVPHLEKLWTADPLGTLNCGEVRGLVASLRDRYPRSKAADAIEAECTRVGLHKLPVAKLARIAGTIYSQQDYDVAMQAHGLSGDRPEQIRARALVRGLVELRSANIEIDAREKQARDERNVEQRVADRVQAEWEKPWLKKKDEGEDSEEGDDESAEKEAQLEDGPPKDDKKDNAPPKKNTPPKKGPPSAPPGGDDMGGDDMGDEPGLNLDGPDEMGDEPGMGGSGPEQAQEVMQEIDEAAQEIINDAPPEAMDFIEHEEAEGHHTAPPGTAQWGAEEILLEDHSAAPPSDEWLAEEMEEMNGGGAPGMDMGGPPGMPPAGPPMGGAPGMGGPPGMGAPALPPPGPGLMDAAAPVPPAIPPVSMQEVAPKMPMKPQAPQAPGHFNRMRGEKMADKEKSKGKGGIPLPGKIKTQPEVTTYAKNISKDNGGKVLKASDVEARLLAGQAVKIGSVSISINSNDEVELWNKEAGRACDLMQLDTAIADFMAMCQHQKYVREAQKITFEYRIAELVSVPCEQCGDMSVFEKAANVQDEYGCDCGHQISAGLVNELSELANWTKSHQLQIRHVAEKTSKDSTQYRILEAMEKLTDENASLDELGPGHILATLRNLDAAAIAKLEQDIQKLGGKIAQMGAPGAPPMGAPGGGAGAGPPGGAGPAVAAGAPLSELIQSAMAHYHNMGMAYLPAVGQLRKDFKERETEFDTPEAGMLVMQVGQQLWSGTGGAPTAGGAGAAGAPGGAPPAAAPPGPGSTTMMAALKFADSKMKAPAIRKPKDHISVPDDLGKDSETSGSIPTPGSIKTQPNKEQHQKLSPKDLGKDSEGKDLLPDPGKPKTTHDPKSQPGIKLPEKGLDGDHEGDEPFKTPSLGAEPKVKKS